MSTFPGIKVIEGKTEIMTTILNKINPEKIAPIENIKKWIRVDNEVYKLDALLANETFYLLNKHPVHEYLDKLFLTGKEDLIYFMKARINPDREEGIDVIITPENFSSLIVCNHDGEIYLVK